MNESHSNASSSSSSSLNSSFQDTEDDQTIASILVAEENSKFDGRLGRRLSHLDSIPHAPKVNGEIPDVNDATLDHGRLSERLATYGLAELQMEGDGNCQFRALADQLFRSPDYHKHVRKQVIKQLKHSRKLYEGYVPMTYQSYLKKMKKSGEWGDHITLQAAADRFGAKICLVTSFRDTCYIEILPKDKNPMRGMLQCQTRNSKDDPPQQFKHIIGTRLEDLKKIRSPYCSEIWMSFWSEVHYNSLYGSGDVPSKAARKKHWLF